MSTTYETPTDAIAWKNGRYIYCLSHGRSQVISPVEFLMPDSDELWDGKQCDWCGKTLTK
jgi:hypothetical protein